MDRKESSFRVPAASVISSRDGTLAKDALLTNALFETTGEQFPLIIKRPGCLFETGVTAGNASRGMFSNAGFLWAVSDSTLFQIDPVSFAVTSIGSVAGTGGNVSFTSTLNDKFIFLHDTTFGYTIQGGITYNNITSPGFPSNNGYTANQVCPGAVYLDGSVYVMTTDGKIWGSAIEDPTTWDPLNFVTAQNDPDGGVAIARQLNYIVAFGTYTIQFFYDAGNSPGSPLLPADSYTLKVGCANGNSVASVESTCFWIAQGKESGKSVMMFNGLTSQTISTPAIEKILENNPLDLVTSFGYRVGGHLLYILNLVTAGITLVYDVQTQTWVTWTSNPTSHGAGGRGR